MELQDNPLTLVCIVLQMNGGHDATCSKPPLIFQAHVCRVNEFKGGTTFLTSSQYKGMPKHKAAEKSALSEENVNFE